MLSDRRLRLLVPVDFSPPSRAALDAALVLAGALPATIDLLHAYPVPDYPFLEAAYVPTDEESARLAAVIEADIAAMVRQVEESHPAANVQTELKNGNPYTEILGAIDRGGHDLVVMGTHGRGFWSRLLLGTVAREVIRHARLPVLTVRASDDEHRALPLAPAKILVPVDLDETSVRALDVAIDLASAMGSAVVVHLSHVPQDPGYPFPFPASVGLTIRDSARRLAALVDERRGLGVELRVVTTIGPPVEEILLQTRDTEVGLIVMGTHRRGRIERALVGSVAEEIVRLAPCPVLTVAEDAATWLQSAPRSTSGRSAPGEQPSRRP